MFCMILSGFPKFFVYFVLSVMEIVVLASESLFQPANGVRSTRSLVEIHNTRVEIHYDFDSRAWWISAQVDKNKFSFRISTHWIIYLDPYFSSFNLHSH